MFCPNCGAKHRDVVYDYVADKEELSNSLSKHEINVDELETVNNEEYAGICPHCGYAIPKKLGEAEIKKLNQVAHNKFHSARNKWNTGMCGIVSGSILFAIAAIFFVLCFKVAENYRFSTEGEPFIVFVALSAISVFLYVFGAIYVAIANKNKKTYSILIKNISNKTFIQK